MQFLYHLREQITWVGSGSKSIYCDHHQYYLFKKKQVVLFLHKNAQLQGFPTIISHVLVSPNVKKKHRTLALEFNTRTKCMPMRA